MPAPAPRPTRRRSARGSWALLALPMALVLPLAVACSGDDAEPDDTPRAEATAPEREPTDVALGTVVGRLPQERRATVRRVVGELVDGWVDAAFLGGAPDPADAFPGFTEQTAAQARDDLELMSNAGLADGADVEAVRSTLRLDVLAPAGRPQGVTARYLLVQRVTDAEGADRRERVSARLAVSRNRKGEWRIFAYDVTRGVAR